MAIFHFSAKIISRGKGQSAIAAASYRSGDRLYDEQAGERKYYPSRDERIVFTDIMAPADAPEWAHDRNQLWNRAEQAERRKDAQLAREIEVALPFEFTDEQRVWLIKDFAREAFVRKGYAVDIAIHAPDKTSDGRNHHAHLMITMRTLGADGFAKTKESDEERAGKRRQGWTREQQLGEWREQWAHLTNRHLERHGHDARVDHRSLKQQGLDREATVHLGYAVSGMAKRDAPSGRMDELREILARNAIRVDLGKIRAEIAALEIVPPTDTPRRGRPDQVPAARAWQWPWEPAKPAPTAAKTHRLVLMESAHRPRGPIASRMKWALPWQPHIKAARTVAHSVVISAQASTRRPDSGRAWAIDRADFWRKGRGHDPAGEDQDR